MEILIPDNYVIPYPNATTLQRFNAIENKDEQHLYKTHHDRFGKVPPEVEKLFHTIRLRWIYRDLGFEK